MESAVVLFTILVSLASGAPAGPVNGNQALTPRNFVPEHIVWNSNADGTQSPWAPNIGSVKACQRATYYSGTPAAGIRRSDCQKLVSQIKSDPGYVSGLVVVFWCFNQYFTDCGHRMTEVGNVVVGQDLWV